MRRGWEHFLVGGRPDRIRPKSPAPPARPIDWSNPTTNRSPQEYRLLETNVAKIFSASNASRHKRCKRSLKVTTVHLGRKQQSLSTTNNIHFRSRLSVRFKRRSFFPRPFPVA